DHLSPGGQLAFQVLADLQDGTGIDPDFDVEIIRKEASTAEFSAPAEAFELMDGYYFFGHRFSFDEASGLFSELTDGEAQIFRPDPVHIYCNIIKP
ncbi:MAG: hypothetical protein ABIK28_16755, partial [Planctomycetota bacterium]